MISCVWLSKHLMRLFWYSCFDILILKWKPMQQSLHVVKKGSLCCRTFWLTWTISAALISFTCSLHFCGIGSTISLLYRLLGWISLFVLESSDESGFANTSTRNQLPQSMKIMHEIMYKLEVLYVLCVLLMGRQRNQVRNSLLKVPIAQWSKQAAALQIGIQLL